MFSQCRYRWVHVEILIDMCEQTYTSGHAYICIHIWVHMYMHVFINVCARVETWCVHTRTRAYAHAHAHFLAVNREDLEAVIPCSSKDNRHPDLVSNTVLQKNYQTPWIRDSL